MANKPFYSLIGTEKKWNNAGAPIHLLSGLFQVLISESKWRIKIEQMKKALAHI